LLSLSAAALPIVLLAFGASQALGQTIYNNSETPLPGNVLSWGFEANSVSEFGDRITFAPVERQVNCLAIEAAAAVKPPAAGAIDEVSRRAIWNCERLRYRADQASYSVGT